MDVDPPRVQRTTRPVFLFIQSGGNPRQSIARLMIRGASSIYNVKPPTLLPGAFLLVLMWNEVIYNFPSPSKLPLQSERYKKKKAIQLFIMSTHKTSRLTQFNC